MTEQQQKIMELVKNFNEYNAIYNKLRMDKQSNIYIVKQNYIYVLGESILTIAQLMGARITYEIQYITEYKFEVIIDSVTFITHLDYDFPDEADIINKIIKYIEDYNDYFSLYDNGKFKHTILFDHNIWLSTYENSNKVIINYGDTNNTEYVIMKDFADYCDEVVCHNNKCAHLQDSFIDILGTKYLLWSDSATGENFITEYKK